MKIFLVGMPGSGKSTLGEKVADALTLPFVDLDTLIEEKAGMAVKEIFSTQGEDAFRLLESATLKEWAGSQNSFVMATGGGAPCFYDGINVINENGLSIFLDVPVHELIQRVSKNQDRPLLHAASIEEQQQRLTTLYQKRKATYEQAKLILKDATVEKVLKALTHDGGTHN